MSTLHVLNIHPVLAAKALTTIDHISNGRLALNIVTGWFKEENEMFGTATSSTMGNAMPMPMNGSQS